MNHPAIYNDTDEVFNYQVFNDLRETVGRAFPRMVEVFLEDTRCDLRELERSLLENNSRQVNRLAYQVKSRCKNFGAKHLAAACQRLEDLSDCGYTRGEDDPLALLNKAYETVEAILEKSISTETGRDTAVGNSRSRLLLVDDDRSMRYALRAILEDAGYQIDEADNGRSALELCEREMPELVLMDAVMPELDGFLACQRLRELPGGAQVPVLIITALDDDLSIERAFASGATDYIPKPLKFAVLLQRIARLLQASRAEKHIRHLAYHDPLTGLANRAQFCDQLDAKMSWIGDDTRPLALLFLDLDRFKLVNETLGHDVGDQLLKAAAARISRRVRASDLVARLGGDEFTVILDRVEAAQVATNVANNICRALAEPFFFSDQKIFLGASIGIAMYPADSSDTTELMQYADIAMFRAKEQGLCYQTYEHGMELALTERMQLESDLRQAVKRNELLLHYQPQIDLKTERLVGFEALVRWQHPQRGLLGPLEFIAIAEESDLIISLGEWVLRTACAQAQSWRERHGPLRLAVNLSGRQLQKPGFVEQLEAVLSDTGLAPELLELEITESTLMHNAEDVVATLQQLEKIGVLLAIDDFGTGYSSLNYLKCFPVTTLKIDRSFIDDINSSADGAALVNAIIALAKSLRLHVVAEGVENRQQMAFLSQHGCDLAQGYYIGKPLPANDVEQLLLIDYANASGTEARIGKMSSPA